MTMTAAQSAVQTALNGVTGAAESCVAGLQSQVTVFQSHNAPLELALVNGAIAALQPFAEALRQKADTYAEVNGIT